MAADRTDARSFSRVALLAAVLLLLLVPLGLYYGCRAGEQDTDAVVSPSQDLEAPAGSESGSGNVVD